MADPSQYEIGMYAIYVLDTMFNLGALMPSTRHNSITALVLQVSSHSSDGKAKNSTY
jgi:hypothetical protein